MKRVDPSILLASLVLTTALGHASAQNASALGGVVRDPRGAPQMGALVELLGPGSNVIAHTYTDDHGRYLIAALAPGRYQLRMSAAFLLPALRRNIHLVPGGRTLADVTLSALFQAGDWFPVEARGKDQPADDWRWTLRSTAERPLLRFGEDGDGDVPGTANTLPTSGESAASAPQTFVLKTSYGSSGLLQDGLRQAVSTEESHGAQLTKLQAIVGEAPGASGKSSLALSAGYEQKNAVTQGTFRAVAGFSSYPELHGAGGSGFQAVNVATGERILLGDVVTIDAGTLLSAERLVSSHISTEPFLRVAVHPTPEMAVMYRYAGSRDVQSLDDLDDLRVSVSPLADAEGRPFTSPASHQELAIARSVHGTVTNLAIYQDAFSTGSLAGGGDPHPEGLAGLPVLANASSGTFVVAVHGYTARGISASWTRTLGPVLKAFVQADLGTTLALARGSTLSLAELQPGLSICTRAAVTGNLAASVPETATTFEVQYHWQPTQTLNIINTFDHPADQAYATVKVRQKLWAGRQPRSISAVLEATNLLEQGYQPIIGVDGETLFLAQVPRAVQAGLSFSF